MVLERFVGRKINSSENMVVGLNFVCVKNDCKNASHCIAFWKFQSQGAVALIDQINRAHSFGAHGMGFKVDDVR